jgi:hypothetical protein
MPIILVAWEDHSLRSAWASSSQDPIYKITKPKWTGGMAQAIEHLLCKCEDKNLNPSPTKKKQNKKTCKMGKNKCHKFLRKGE